MNDTARMNVTWGGANGDLPDPVPYDATDNQLRAMATEAVRTGSIPGIPADRTVDLTDFVVDRFTATPEIPQNRVFIRPKTPFGRRDPGAGSLTPTLSPKGRGRHLPPKRR